MRVACGSYIETIRPVAEMYGIAKIVPPDGWKPPDTPMKEHINKLLPTKKQALHCLMNVRPRAHGANGAGSGWSGGVMSARAAARARVVSPATA